MKRTHFLTFTAIILVCLFLLTTVAQADSGYYRQFVKGSKSLGFEPTKNFVNEIYAHIKGKYPTDVSDQTLFAGAKRELKSLAAASGQSTAFVDALPADGQVLNQFLKKYKGKINTNLAVFAAGRGMVESLNDPETELILPSDSKDPRRDLIPEGYGGIGVLIEERGGNVIVIHAFEGGPADKAGLKPGDAILAINGASVKTMDLDSVRAKLMGTEGSTVSISLKRGGQALKKTAKREKISLNPVYAGVSKNGVGYIKIVYFSDTYPEQVYNAIEKFRNRGIKTWVLDLRDNAGGSLNQLIVMGSLFFPAKEPIYVVKYKDKERAHHSVAKTNFMPPAAVIVNSYTTGSAEALAADFREYTGAKIYGTTTRGNAAVAEFLKLSGGATLKLTVGSMQTGHKRPIHKAGIKPDVRVGEADNPANEAAVLAKVISLVKK